jgi:thiol-disulfide isomerase/thioredoxin
VCLGGMGILFTAVFTYFGFGLLLWGSLWNANLLEKLSKAKTQWDHLRGNTPAGKTMSSPIAVSDGRGSVASVDSDAEFKKLIGTGARVIVQFSASWYDRQSFLLSRLITSDRHGPLRFSYPLQSRIRSRQRTLKIMVFHVLSLYMYRCSPCKQIAPVFAELSAQYAASAGISFLKLDVDECEESAEGVSSMPTFKYYSGMDRACMSFLAIRRNTPSLPWPWMLSLAHGTSNARGSFRIKLYCFRGVCCVCVLYDGPVGIICIRRQAGRHDDGR